MLSFIGRLRDHQRMQDFRDLSIDYWKAFELRFERIRNHFMYVNDHRGASFNPLFSAETLLENVIPGVLCLPLLNFDLCSSMYV